jgi:cupin superfamily protein DUF985
MLSADEIVRLLDLEPHPEGGRFRETFRDTATVASGADSARAASTAIYFLLRAAGATSGWAPILPPASARKRWCRPAPGSRRQAWAIGRWSAARWLPASSSRASSWRRRASSRAPARVRSCIFPTLPAPKPCCPRQVATPVRIKTLSFPELCRAAEAIATARACGRAATQILHGKHKKKCDSLGVVENAQGIWRTVPERGVR